MANGHNLILHSLAGGFAAEGVPCRFIARGSSMVPFICCGDEVTIGPCRRRMRVGDVVLIRKSDDRLLLHRVISTTGSGVVTRGDACIEDDGLTPYGDVIGMAMGTSGAVGELHLHFPYGHFLSVVLRIKRYPWLYGPVRFLAKRLLRMGSGQNPK